MRFLLRLPVLGLATLLAFSASADAQTNEEKFEAKMKSEFIQNVAWETNFEAAQKTAQAEHKIIFGYFTRSYAP